MFFSATYASPLGRLTLACQGESLIGLWLEGQKYFGAGLPQGLPPEGDTAVLRAAKHWLKRYFAGEKPAIAELPLAPGGSTFRQEVLAMLCAIPYGQVRSYGGLAREMAEKIAPAGSSARAIGGAVGHNPISIIIPCHRVVGANGSLTGYAGGLAAKTKLLELEGVNISAL